LIASSVDLLSVQTRALSMRRGCRRRAVRRESSWRLSGGEVEATADWLM
jgi:hypothetical protein